MAYKNPESQREYNRKRRSNPEYRAYQKAYHKVWHKARKAGTVSKVRIAMSEEDRMKSKMLSRSKHRAKRDNLPFNLQIEDIHIPLICPVLGIKLEFAKGGTAQDNSPSLDKIKPLLGYVKGNVWVISARANRIKYDATLEELELVVLALKKL